MDEAFDGPVETWTVRVDADTGPLEEATQVRRRFGTAAVSSALINAFEGIAIKGRSLGECSSRWRIGLAAEGGVPAAGAGAATCCRGCSPAVPFRQGRGLPRACRCRSPRAASQSIAFPLALERTGIAGERGRGDHAASRAGPMGASVSCRRRRWDLCHVQRRDAGCRNRRSETQVAAMLARAVALGQRNL